MAVLQVKGVRILDGQLHGLLQALCGLQRRGDCFLACAQNKEVCDTLIRFLAFKVVSPMPLAAGAAHTCAVKANGDLACFGFNDEGQCDVPPDLGPVVAVAAGAAHTCAVKANGDLACFELNDDGQCDVPPDLGPGPVVAVAAGHMHTCAVKADGDLACFGLSDEGQCDVPPDLGPVVAVEAGAAHTCAVKANGDLVCFGLNDDGQCDVPPDLGPVVAVAVGHMHTCAVKADGDLACFGLNDEGQCDVPPDLGPVVAVAAGANRTCAVKANGDLVCFGLNDEGQCDVPPDLGPVVAVAAGANRTCAVKANGDLVCFGFNSWGQCDVPPDLGPVAAGRGHTCAVEASRDSECCGQNVVGQCEAPANCTGWKCNISGASSCLEPVVQHVHHSEPASRIPEHEAATVVAQQEASFIEHNLDSAGWHGHQASSRASHARHRVVVLHFSRSPPELREVLESSEELWAVRNELEQTGCRWTLASGAKVFLPPGVYRELLPYLGANPALEQQLQSCHVLVSEHLEEVVLAQIRKLRSRLQVRLRDREVLSFSGFSAASASEEGWSISCTAGSAGREVRGWDAEGMEIVVSRSFLELRLRKEEIPDAVTQSTTQARPGHGYGGTMNPRSAAAHAEFFE